MKTQLRICDFTEEFILFRLYDTFDYYLAKRDRIEYMAKFGDYGVIMGDEPVIFYYTNNSLNSSEISYISLCAEEKDNIGDYWSLDKPALNGLVGNLDYKFPCVRYDYGTIPCIKVLNHFEDFTDRVVSAKSETIDNDTYKLYLYTKKEPVELIHYPHLNSWYYADQDV